MDAIIHNISTIDTARIYLGHAESPRRSPGEILGPRATRYENNKHEKRTPQAIFDCLFLSFISSPIVYRKYRLLIFQAEQHASSYCIRLSSAQNRKRSTTKLFPHFSFFRNMNPTARDCGDFVKNSGNICESSDSRISFAKPRDHFTLNLLRPDLCESRSPTSK
ncbi:hypothetical protein Trydic_g21817 [Trypoxylus dichotomus]